MLEHVTKNNPNGEVSQCGLRVTHEGHEYQKDFGSYFDVWCNGISARSVLTTETIETPNNYIILVGPGKDVLLRVKHKNDTFYQCLDLSSENIDALISALQTLKEG